MASGPIRWARLEPRSRDPSLSPGLEARVHDPLWLLGRQWQFGELVADGDIGSVVAATVSAHAAPAAAYRPAIDGDGRSHAFDPAAVPLEALVEAEDPRSEQTARMRARAGLHFERLLAAHGQSRYAPAYREVYPIAPGARTPDAASERFVSVVAGRASDGSRLYADLDAALRPEGGASPALPAAPAVAAAHVPAVTAAAQAFLAWCDGLYAALPERRSAWVPERMEYAFTITAGGTTLEAGEYSDGHLDWHAFTARAAPGSTGDPMAPVTTLPSSVTYPGMPASRLWEFEDARVDFGAVQADPEDLGRMLLTEFALVYGGDWLLAPLEVPVGTLVRVHALELRDTFGNTTRVDPAAQAGGWSMFALSDPVDGASDALLVAPALVSGLHGRPIEEVLLLRDETANLAWAVERAVHGDTGHASDRAAMAYQRRPDAVPETPTSDVLRYRLRTEVPEHWLPLLPQRLQPDDPSMTLKLAAMPRSLPDGTTAVIPPLGRLLRAPAAGVDVVIQEEEVPREGARVIRAFQLARGSDGSTHLWLGRRKQVGRGEGSSGLRFDAIDDA